MTRRWALPPFTIGEFAPSFTAPTRANPSFHFSTTAGRYVLLAFIPADPARRQAACAAFEAVRGHFDDLDRAALFVTTEAPDTAPPDHLPGQRWLFDPDGAARALFHLRSDNGGWFLLDPALRLMASAPLETPEALFDQVRALPAVDDYAGVPLVAPALIVPRVFEPDLCQRLIASYDAGGDQPSGAMRTIGDEALRREVMGAVQRNLIPMIQRAFQFQATRIERTAVACYDAEHSGHSRPHRDNGSLGTAHRKFACSINLNADDVEGGDLRLPEFGRRTYRPPTGGAVVFCCSLQHEVTPVTRGRRYVFLPFVYDEAGQALRERNLGRVQNHEMSGQPG